MPPPAVKTVEDLIYWQYAKIISKSAGYGMNYGFIMNRFKGLQSGAIRWSGSIREWVLEHERPEECIYCGSSEPLTTDHLIPRSRGGPDVGDNAIVACRSCNASKGDRGVYEWYGLDVKDEVPRVAEGKYLKLLHDLHREAGTLDSGRANLQELCDRCAVPHLCDESRLTVYCLESILLPSTAQASGG
jgi:hypothetical protein